MNRRLTIAALAVSLAFSTLATGCTSVYTSAAPPPRHGSQVYRPLALTGTVYLYSDNTCGYRRPTYPASPVYAEIPAWACDAVTHRQIPQPFLVKPYTTIPFPSCASPQAIPPGPDPPIPVCPEP